MKKVINGLMIALILPLCAVYAAGAWYFWWTSSSPLLSVFAFLLAITLSVFLIGLLYFVGDMAEMSEAEAKRQNEARRNDRK